MTDPLLVLLVEGGTSTTPCNHHDYHHRSSCSQQRQQDEDEQDKQEEQDCGQGKRSRRETSNKNPSSSSSCWGASCVFYLLRPRFFMSGFLFGVLLEFAYVQTIRLGYANLEFQAAAADTYHTVQMDSWTDVLFAELYFLYSDVMFLLYLVILTRSALKKTLTVSLPIMAANWTVGMVLGLSVTVVCLFGSKMSVHQWICQALGIMIVGVALCFVGYTIAMEVQTHCTGKNMSTCHRGGRQQQSCCDGENKKFKKQEGTPPPPPSEEDVNDPDTISLIEAQSHIV